MHFVAVPVGNVTFRSNLSIAIFFLASIAFSNN